MQVVFLGVGEAFDETLPNTSILVRCGLGASRVTVLLDCGFTAPPQFWRAEPSADALDAVWISHFHGDHFMGLPALLVRFWEERRTKPLTILGQKGVEPLTRQSVDLAYSGFYEKIRFPILYQEVEPGGKEAVQRITFRAAENDHSRRDLALRLDAGGKSVFYSGDGRPTPETIALAGKSDLIIHEAFHLDTPLPGHGTVMGCLEMARTCGASALALVHIQRQARKEVLARFKDLRELASPVNLMVPTSGDRTTI
jgi:ribonuclease Z